MVLAIKFHTGNLLRPSWQKTPISVLIYVSSSPGHKQRRNPSISHSYAVTVCLDSRPYLPVWSFSLNINKLISNLKSWWGGGYWTCFTKFSCRSWREIFGEKCCRTQIFLSIHRQNVSSWMVHLVRFTDSTHVSLCFGDFWIWQPWSHLLTGTVEHTNWVHWSRRFLCCSTVHTVFVDRSHF